jgi:hypothetical protein
LTVVGNTVIGQVIDNRANGANDGITVVSDTVLQPVSANTYMMWVRRIGDGTTAPRIIEKGDNPRLYYATGSSTSLQYIHGTGGSTVDMLISTPNNQWIHVAVTFDGTTIRFYKNGILTTSALPDVTQTYSATVLSIGNTSGGGRNFNGMITGVQIFSEAKSSSYILDTYLRERKFM